ncbi:hypothetical protein [Alicyclobacillus fodiniaquatilis]|uniref:DUF4062 domain-containing protein n=1 Tax=Alicyclobacillus fodiniaquatilis TaxID=1661150 RepID=A0ABW4JJ68_9BACL
MAYTATVYRVLVASPSDVTEERAIVPKVIYEWNASHSAEQNVVLLPVKWETHSVPELGDHPQQIINKQLVGNCDILIGAFWTRLGTHTGVAESGTLEEIEEFRQQGKPVALFFSSKEVAPNKVDWPQYQKLLQQKELFKKAGLIGEYSSLEDFEELLTRTLHTFVRTLVSNEKPSDTDKTQSNSATQPLTSKEISKVGQVKKLISTNASIELQDMVRQDTISCREFILTRPNDSADVVQEFSEQLKGYVSNIKPLAGVLSTLACYGDALNRKLIRQAFSRLVDIPRSSGKTILLDLKLLPTLYCMYAVGVSSVAADDYETLLTLTESKIFDIHENQRPLITDVHPYSVFEHSLELVPRPRANEYTPLSNWMYEELYPLLDWYTPTETEYEKAFTLYEFICGLMMIDSRTSSGWDWAPLGRYYWQGKSQRMIESWLTEGHALGTKWTPLKALFDGDQERFVSVLGRFEKFIHEASRGQGVFSTVSLLETYR